MSKASKATISTFSHLSNEKVFVSFFEQISKMKKSLQLFSTVAQEYASSLFALQEKYNFFYYLFMYLLQTHGRCHKGNQLCVDL